MDNTTFIVAAVTGILIISLAATLLSYLKDTPTDKNDEEKLPRPVPAHRNPPKISKKKVTPTSNIEGMTKNELIAYAKERGINVTPRLKKSELQNIIREHDES